MDDLVSGSIAEVVELVATAVLSSALAIVGSVVELAGVGNLSTGHLGIGLWEVAIGGLLLYAGVYVLGYRRVIAVLLERRLARQ